MKKKHKHNLPKDRTTIVTEQRNPRTMNLHELSAAECVKVMNEENHEALTAIEKASKTITKFIEAAEEKFNAGGRLIYIGAGTSGRLGVLDSAEAPPTFQVESARVIGIIAGGDSALRTSSEGKEDNPNGACGELDRLSLTKNDIVLGIAAGGTTPYVLGALDYAKKCKTELLTGLLACTHIPSPPGVDFLIILETGPEVLTGSTRLKAGTATKLVLNTISTTLMIRSGRVYENLMVDVRVTNEKLLDRAIRIVSTLTERNRNESFDLLKRAEGVVKTAIVMHYHNLSQKKAKELLDSHGGRLDKVLKS